MNLRYHRRRVADVAAGIKLSRELIERERWPVERLRAHQRDRVADLIRHAAERSPYYRERIRPDTPLEEIAPIGKRELMGEFDRIVTDPRLRRDELLAGVEGMTRDRLFAGEYRVMATSGSSGRKGLFVYDAGGWRATAAMFMRQTATAGVQPRLPRWRMAIIGGSAPSHMSRQGAATLAIGVHRVLGLPVTLPVAEMVAALNEFRPQYMNVYPTVAARLAEEADAGRLRIELEAMSTSSELCPPPLHQRLTASFGIRPFDLYATTEGLFGLSCERHDGLHLYEDMAIVENVDAAGRPVPPGEPGERLLVTNLENRVRPIIRLEVGDVMTLAAEPCPCGRCLVLARGIQGRSDDVIELDGVRILPAEFALVTGHRDVREFQVVQHGHALAVRVVASDAAAPGLADELRERLSRRLAELGVERPEVRVELRDELPRQPGGKLRLVVADAQAPVRSRAGTTGATSSA